MASRVCHTGGCEADTLPAREEMISTIMNVTGSLGQLVEIQNGQSTLDKGNDIGCQRM